MTVLLPDLRGHGQEPPVAASSFGWVESDDALAALEYLRGLKSPQGRALVGGAVGVYGVEVGAYAALAAARRDPAVRAVVLDSVPDNPDDVLAGAVRDRTGFDNRLLQALARLGTRVYFAGRYKADAACTLAEGLGDRQVLLLSGEGAGASEADDRDARQLLPRPRQRRDAHRPPAHRPRPSPPPPPNRTKPTTAASSTSSTEHVEIKVSSKRGRRVDCAHRCS